MKIYRKRDYARKATHAPPRISFSEKSGQIKFNAPAMAMIANRPVTIGYDKDIFYLIIAGEDDSILDFFIVKKVRMAFSCLSIVKDVLKKSNKHNFIIDVDHPKLEKNQTLYKLIDTS